MVATLSLTKLLRPVCLALANALDLWRVQGIDLAAALAALCSTHAGPGTAAVRMLRTNARRIAAGSGRSF